ncbi:MAG: carboxylesterase family protein [Gammaproteobacteria bacterium]|nr:carboxylesterase family protein [Gammaproteobacteria bacterium]
MKNTFLGLLAALVFAACTSQPVTNFKPIVAPESSRSLPGGQVVGFQNAAGGYSWLGIPYAASPVDDLRWRAPRPYPAWSGRREALEPGSPCIQYGSPLYVGGVGGAGTRQGSEDCLFLNVYAPPLSQGEASEQRLPVMVWIHGGGNTVGHAAFYDGQVLATQKRLVVVMINYRLGPLGWFVPPENISLTSSNPDPDLSGNYGNLDIVETLRWVQSNVTAFGGDPANVTVIGESAGATNALALLVMPAAEGLFHRLIVQSLGFGFARTPSLEASSGTVQILRRALIATGRAQDSAEAEQVARAMSASEQSAFLRSLDPWAIYGTYRRDGDYGRVPTVFQDGVVIRRGELRDLLADPTTHIDVPVILGTNRDEPKIFMAFDRRHVRTVAGLPFALRDTKAYDLEARYRSLVWKADGVDSLAEILSRSGAPAWAYRWDWDEQGKLFGVVDLSRIVGAAHGLEIPFVFGFFDVGPQGRMLFNDGNIEGRLALSERMMSYWAGFARDGNPGRGSDSVGPEWAPWGADKASPRMMVFDTVAGGGARMQPSDVSRESIFAEMEKESMPVGERCALFKATFRNREDDWADGAWRRFAGGACVGQRLGS